MHISNLKPVLRAVLFAALLGVAGIVSADPSSDTNQSDTSLKTATTPPVEVAPQLEKKSPADKSASVEEQLSSINEQITKLSSDLKKARRHNGILWILVIAMAVSGYVMNRKTVANQNQRDEEQDRKFRELKKNINKSLDEASNKLNKKVENLASGTQAPSPANAHSAHNEPTPPTNAHSAHKVQSNNPTIQQSSNQIKYFMLQESGGRLLVRERNLKDEPVGMFCMEIKGNRATYDLNRKRLSQTLSDLATLRNCTNDFDSKNNARDIVTVRPGTMEKQGMDWIVVEKLTIKLN